MTNEELAAKIHVGQKEYIDLLWSNVENFVRQEARKFYASHQDRCQQVGAEIEDLTQVGFFAVVKAVDAYKPGYVYLTYLGYHLSNEFRKLAKMRSTGWQNNTIYQACSLDNLVSEEDDTRFIDLLADTEDIEESIAEADYQARLKQALSEILPVLSDRQKEILHGLYYRGLSYRKLASELNITTSSINNVRKGAFKKLKAYEPLQVLAKS